MYIKNKENKIYLDYKLSAVANNAGITHETVNAYWFKNDKKIYPADRVTKFSQWDKFYIPALTGDQLNDYLPKGTVITRIDKNLWKAELPLEKCSAIKSTEAEAKLYLIIKLIKAGLVKP